MQWLKVNRLDTQQANFEAQLSQLLGWESVSDQRVQKTVADIIERVKLQGDTALLQLTNQLDRTPFKTASELEIPQQKLDQALAEISHQEREALQTAAARIRAYHQHQRQDSWSYVEADGTSLGQQITAMDRVGIYVPGGKASYPSSVLMNAIPAKVAGVKEIIMTVPLPNGKVNPLVLAAAAIAGVDRVFAIGGAQAIAALAYGTPMVPKVDKIVGPGNIYVATAKRAVFGACGIDMIAGPSEILIICDGKTDPDWVVMDLFSQAEHDELAQSILISNDEVFLNLIQKRVTELLPQMPRRAVIEKSLRDRGALILVDNLSEACEIANRIAPEHLELSVEEPRPLIEKIENAGAIFIGKFTSEALGDYCAGPNHVLPTSGTSRFSSPLGVYDFQKRTSLIEVSESGARELGSIAAKLAREEGLEAHARSAEKRYQP